MEIGVIGNEHFVAGFQLAGVRKTYVVNGYPMETVHQAMRDSDIGILIMNADDYEKLDGKLKEKVLTQVSPTVIVLSHDVSAEESLRAMIIRALGIDLWSKEHNGRKHL